VGDPSEDEEQAPDQTEETEEMEEMDIDSIVDSETNGFDSDQEQGQGQGQKQESTHPQSKRVSLWFTQPLFNEILTDQVAPNKSNAPLDMKKEVINPVDVVEEEFQEQKPKAPKSTSTATTTTSKEKSKDKKSKKKQKDQEEEDGFEEVPIEQPKVQESESDADSDTMTERLALATYAYKTGRFSELHDNAYNRYAWNDDDLPSWFADDENRHNKPMLPITKDIAQQIKQRFMDINARPIKKVAEAKARKKKRAINRLEKLKTKASNIVKSSDMSEREKMKQIEKLYHSNPNKMKPSRVYVVSRKYQSAPGRKSKGPVKVVDPRMKKDLRAEKQKDSKKRKRR